MAKTKIYSNDGQKVKELSVPIIRGKKYPAGTIVTNDPNDPRLMAHQDSLQWYNEDKNYYQGYLDDIQDDKVKVLMPTYDDLLKNEYSNLEIYPGMFVDNTSGLTIEDIYGKYGINSSGINMSELSNRPTQSVVYQPFISKMTSKGLPNSPELIPNERIMPDIIYKDNNIPNAAYNKGLDIYHRTDGLGRWAAQLIMSTQPGIRGRISTPNPKGNYTKIYKYK